MYDRRTCAAGEDETIEPFDILLFHFFIVKDESILNLILICIELPCRLGCVWNSRARATLEAQQCRLTVILHLRVDVVRVVVGCVHRGGSGGRKGWGHSWSRLQQLVYARDSKKARGELLEFLIKKGRSAGTGAQKKEKGVDV